MVRSGQWSENQVLDINYVLSCKSTRYGDKGTQGFRAINHSSQTDAFSWNGRTKCEQVYTEQIKLDKNEERLSTASLVPSKLSDSCLPK